MTRRVLRLTAELTPPKIASARSVRAASALLWASLSFLIRVWRWSPSTDRYAPARPRRGAARTTMKGGSQPTAVSCPLWPAPMDVRPVDLPPVEARTRSAFRPDRLDASRRALDDLRRAARRQPPADRRDEPRRRDATPRRIAPGAAANPRKADSAATPPRRTPLMRGALEAARRQAPSGTVLRASVRGPSLRRRRGSPPMWRVLEQTRATDRSLASSRSLRRRA